MRYFLETKFDGERLIVHVSKTLFLCQTRNRTNYSQRYEAVCLPIKPGDEEFIAFSLTSICTSVMFVQQI